MATLDNGEAPPCMPALLLPVDLPSQKAAVEPSVIDDKRHREPERSQIASVPQTIMKPDNVAMAEPDIIHGLPPTPATVDGHPQIDSDGKFKEASLADNKKTAASEQGRAGSSSSRITQPLPPNVPPLLTENGVLIGLPPTPSMLEDHPEIDADGKHKKGRQQSARWTPRRAIASARAVVSFLTKID